ncbi:membrane protein [Candidatus Magnetomorum sp. HK-1]|nr:membrane protein [Candidatus Magnetomorum sp. HK-1]
MNKSKHLLFGANAYAGWAFVTCLFMLIADFVFIIAFLVSFSGFEYIVFDIIGKDILSMIFIIINTYFVIKAICNVFDIEFIVFRQLSAMIVFVHSKDLYKKIIKFQIVTFKDIVDFISIFSFSVGVAGGLHIIITFILWLIIDKFNYQISFLSNLQHWVYHHYPLLCFYVYLYVLSLYAIKIYYLWKTDSDLKKFLDIFPSWKNILKEHHR